MKYYAINKRYMIIESADSIKAALSKAEKSARRIESSDRPDEPEFYVRKFGGLYSIYLFECGDDEVMTLSANGEVFKIKDSVKCPPNPIKYPID